MTSKGKGGRNQGPQLTEDEITTSTKNMMHTLDEQELESLYAWVDGVPLSRPKRNISRDFSDGVLVAEIMKHFLPKLVEMHNYSPANASSNKKSNWRMLNSHVFNRLHFELAEDVIDDLVSGKPGMIEKVLLVLQVKINSAKYAQKHHSDKPEADQHHSPGRKEGQLMKYGMDSTRGTKGAKAKTIRETIKTELNSNVEFNGSLDAKIQHREHSVGTTIAGKPPTKVAQKKRMGPLVEPDMVPRYVVEEKEQEVLSRDETIQILQAKISRLEHLLHLKDMRIDDLQGRVESMRPTGIKK